MKRALAIGVLLVAPCVWAQTPVIVSGAPVKNPALHDELKAMHAADQDVRKRSIADPKNETLIAEWKAVDARNLARLKEIIAQYGWPTAEMVGKDGVMFVWTMSQHAGTEFLHSVLPMMKAAVDRGDLAPGLYATSVDRTRIQDKQKQLYGSQFNTRDGKCEPLPIEDAEHVEERRKAMGLGSLSEYAKQLCELYHLKPTWP